MAAVRQEALQDTPTAKEAYIASKEAYIDGKRDLLATRRLSAV